MVQVRAADDVDNRRSSLKRRAYVVRSLSYRVKIAMLRHR